MVPFLPRIQVKDRYGNHYILKISSSKKFVGLNSIFVGHHNLYFAYDRLLCIPTPIPQSPPVPTSFHYYLRNLFQLFHLVNSFLFGGECFWVISSTPWGLFLVVNSGITSDNSGNQNAIESSWSLTYRPNAHPLYNLSSSKFNSQLSLTEFRIPHGLFSQS